MADLPCDLCAEERAILLQTNVGTGDVIGVGEACLFPFAIGTARAVADVMPGDVKAHYAPSAAALAEDMGVTLADVPKRGQAAPDAAPADGAAGGDGGGGQGGTEAPGALELADEPDKVDVP